MEDSYVYITLNKKDRKVMYIGSGKGNRMSHVLSGRSSSVEANRAVLLGEGDYETFVFVNGVPKSTANQIEAGLIYALQPEWNKKGLFDQPDIGFEFLLNSLRVKAYLDFLNYQGMAEEDIELRKLLNSALIVFCRVEQDWVSADLINMYSMFDKLVEYFLEEGEWFKFPPKTEAP